MIMKSDIVAAQEICSNEYWKTLTGVILTTFDSLHAFTKSMLSQSCQKDNIARRRQPYVIKMATIYNPSDSKGLVPINFFIK